MRSPRSRSSAFTLIELMIVIALVAIVVSLAGPSFREYILMQRLRSVHAQIGTDLAYARSEAVSRGSFVQLRVQSSSDLTCYIIYSRSDNASSSPCDCTAAAGSRCSGSTTTEIKTAIAPASEGIVISASGTESILTINPRSGGSDAPPPAEDVPAPDFKMDAKLADNSRIFRTAISATGRITNCSPGGSVAGTATC
jgi:prepilin-type N-terminal cleavage/methylation domain-containing protein